MEQLLGMNATHRVLPSSKSIVVLESFHVESIFST